MVTQQTAELILEQLQILNATLDALREDLRQRADFPTRVEVVDKDQRYPR